MDIFERDWPGLLTTVNEIVIVSCLKPNILALAFALTQKKTVCGRAGRARARARASVTISHSHKYAEW
ncbi:hypothetical protein JXA32_02330 [Candidatus Sumerlaeota bacterium]|nr:hypothetical protein [Candidatus Sumerlaeota bacterium]